MKSNCLLWLPVKRRRSPLVAGLVLFTYLQNAAVSSQLMVCLAPSAQGALELQKGLQQVLSVLSSQVGGPHEGGPSEGLITRLWAPGERCKTVAANQRESIWQHEHLRVRWGAPACWAACLRALKKYKEALLKQEGVSKPQCSSHCVARLTRSLWVATNWAPPNA